MFALVLENIPSYKRQVPGLKCSINGWIDKFKDEPNDEKIRKNTDFIEKIDLDYNKLKENLDYNKRNMGEIVKDNFRKSVFTLQEEFYNQFNDFNNIESELQKLEQKDANH